MGNLTNCLIWRTCEVTILLCSEPPARSFLRSEHYPLKRPSGNLPDYDAGGYRKPMLVRTDLNEGRMVPL